MALLGARRRYPSLTLGRVGQSALRFRAGAADCDKVCHLTQIRHDLRLACGHCSSCLSEEIQSLPCRVMRGEGIQVAQRPRSKVVRVFSTLYCLGLFVLRKVRGMHCEGIPVECRPRPNAPSRVSTGDRLNFVDCDSKSWQRSPRQCLCRSRTFLVSIPVG